MNFSFSCIYGGLCDTTTSLIDIAISKQTPLMINLLDVCECFVPKMVTILFVVVQHYEELYNNNLNNKYVEI